MKIPVLGDLMTEVNRLFIAGAKLSTDDPRLSKLIPVLEKMGERAPVFQKLAADTAGLIAAPQEETGERLLALGTLLYSILYTQGETSAVGEYAALQAVCGMPVLDQVRTDVNYGRLWPLIEALTTQSPGRLEVIESAYRDGLFRDLRTHGAAVGALDDRYGEIVTLIEQTVIPHIGSAAIPHLLAQYDPKGDKGAGRRLRGLGRLGYQGAEQLAQQALDSEGTSVPVCVAAIEVMGQRPSNEPLLLALAKDKKKELREAALIALVELDSVQGKEILQETFRGKGYKAALTAMTHCRDKAVKLMALAAVQDLEEEALKTDGDKKEQTARCERFLECAGTLPGLLQAPFIEYMRHVLTTARLRKASGMGNWALQNLYRQYLDELDRLPYGESASILKELAQDRELTKFYAYGVRLWFLKAAQTYSPREMYKEFYRYYSANQLDTEVFETAYPQNLLEMLEGRWIDEWLKSRNTQFKLLAVRLSDSEEKGQMKKLCTLLLTDLAELASRKTSYLPPHIPLILEKLVQSRIDLKKELKPVQAQQLLNGHGRGLSQPVQEVLTAIAVKN